jgi:hypothetical protein
LLVLGAALAAPAGAQDPAPVYQSDGKQLSLRADLLLRQEWNRDFLAGIAPLTVDDRRRVQFRPRLEFGSGLLQLGVGGEFNYSSDDNTLPPAGQTVQALIRDNYDSRQARLDLAYLRLEPRSGIRLQGGRFVLPVELTEMIWDKDLRPQGAALTLGKAPAAGQTGFSLTGLWARGSHVFDDDDTDMYVGSAALEFPAGTASSLQLVGSYIEWRGADALEPRLRRQNNRVAGVIRREFKVVDLIARLRTTGQVPLQLVADLSWNTAVDDQKRGMWLAAVLGSVKSSVARLEYVYSKVDRDATLAAYSTDDFFWGTGWEGHKLDLGTNSGHNSALHAVGQLQRFKDSANAAEREHWVKRLRVELRVTY